jgi:phosphoribosylanthranilate isomerase
MTMIKICGVTLPDDAARTAAAGVEFIGINLWPKSKRYVAPSRAPILAAAARAAGNIQIVGVFVDATAAQVAAAMQEIDLDVLQLHGDESPAEVAAIARIAKRPVWKALAARRGTPPGMSVVGVDQLGARVEMYATADAILLDTPSPSRGGSGETFDWAIARDVRTRYPARLLVLAGGLGPDNVAAAIAAVDPWAVDLASGVETAPGIKDPAKITDLVAAVRATRS